MNENIEIALSLVTMVCIIIATSYGVYYLDDKISGPLIITVNEKFCTTDVFVQGCYITDYSKQSILPNSGNIRIRENEVYNTMQIGKTYRCIGNQISTKELFDINPNHQYLICEEKEDDKL